MFTHKSASINSMEFTVRCSTCYLKRKTRKLERKDKFSYFYNRPNKK